MALKGTLRDFNLADIFQLIGIQKKTGVLTLRSAREVVTVSFVNGDVVAADSLHRRLEDRLGTVLVKSGRVSEAQLQEALRIQKNTLKRMGNILVENGFISAEDLREALQIQITQMVYRLFRWRDGEYNFSQEERVEYDRQNVTPMSAESILMEGARILDEWPMIEKALKSFSTVFRRASVEIAPPGQKPSEAAGEEDAQAVRLSDQERAVHALVDGRKSVQEIVERSTLSEFDTCRILFELLGRQIIEEVPSPAQRATASEAALAPRAVSPALVGLGYLLLALAVGGALLFRSVSWVVRASGPEALVASALSPLMGGDAVEVIRGEVGRSRLQRVDFALRVYYLLNRGYPVDLGYLVTSHLLHPEAIRDPWGRPFRYEVVPDGYRLSFPGPDKYAARPAAPAGSAQGPDARR
ncbi:MAG: DUF4388 domain-containing protein [Acidobacteriota bacterium]